MRPGILRLRLNGYPTVGTLILEERIPGHAAAAGPARSGRRRPDRETGTRRYIGRPHNLTGARRVLEASLARLAQDAPLEPLIQKESRVLIGGADQGRPYRFGEALRRIVCDMALEIRRSPWQAD